MTTSTKKADTPKKTVKNGKVYGDALSAAEKKKIVMQKKKLRSLKANSGFTEPLETEKRSN